VAKLTPKEAMAAYQIKILAVAARRRTKDSLTSFQTDVSSFVDYLRRLCLKLLPETDVVRDGLRHRPWRCWRLKEWEIDWQALMAKGSPARLQIAVPPLVEDHEEHAGQELGKREPQNV
jgi:hypothetical protein